jgi:hypothetical protein
MSTDLGKDLTQEPHLARPSSFGNRNRMAQL